jgi:hypothetical protein
MWIVQLNNWSRWFLTVHRSGPLLVYQVSEEAHTLPIVSHRTQARSQAARVQVRTRVSALYLPLHHY